MGVELRGMGPKSRKLQTTRSGGNKWGLVWRSLEPSLNACCRLHTFPAGSFKGKQGSCKQSEAGRLLILLHVIASQPPTSPIIHRAPEPETVPELTVVG